MKKFKKLLITLLSFALVLTMSLSIGCSCNKPSDNGGEGENESFGTHIIKTEVTDKEFIRNGSTNYKLVTPANPTTYESLAKKEFVNFYEQATGSKIGCIPDTGITGHDATQKYISLGSTTLLKSLSSDQINYDKATLNYEGVRIKTIDNNIYLTGSSDQGTVFAVYEFLELAFNFDIYWVDTWEIDSVSNLNLINFDVTDVPDIQKRSSILDVENRYESINESREDYKYYGWRVRRPISYWKAEMGVPIYEYDSVNKVYKISGTSSATMHNDMELLPKEIYGAEHPAWYSNGGDLCFTSGTKASAGNYAACDAESDLMYRELAKRVVQALMHNYQKDKSLFNSFIPITHEDASSPCGCWYCTEINTTYTYSAIYIKAMKKIEQYVTEFLNEEKAKCDADPEYSYYYEPKGINLRYEDYYRDDWSILFFAYGYSNDAPVTMDEDGNVTAMSPDFYLNKHVTVWFASQPGPATLDMNFRGTLTQKDTRKTNFIKNAKGWDLLSPNGYLYQGYATSFSDCGYPWDAFAAYGVEHIRLLAQTNCKEWFIYTGFGRFNFHEDVNQFAKFYMYVVNKFTWNINSDYDKCVEKFFNAMYKDGADDMYRLYEMFKEYSAFQYITQPGFTVGSGTTPKFWDLNAMLKMIDLCYDALDKIEYLKDVNPDLYNKTKLHIDSEFIAPCYVVLNHYRTQLQPELLSKLKNKLTDVAYANNIKNTQTFVNSLD